MKVHKTGRKLNRAGYPKETSRFGKTTCVVCMAAVLARAGCFVLPAQAAPATLKSPDATVYEQADEGSNAVGNLVEGSSFEYIGDVAAEDGSVWHQVTTTGGAAGYIRGDRELELIEGEPVPDGQEGQGEPEGQDAPAEDGGDTAPAENGPAEAGEGADENINENTDENPDENTGVEAGRAGEEAPEDEEDGEAPEEGDGEGLEDDDAVVAVMNMQNGQTKKYVVDTSGKIKERGSFAEENTGIQSVKNRKAGMDKTLVTSIAVMCFSIGAINLCLSRMGMLRWGTDAKESLDPDKSRIQRKIEKKKRSQKKKAKKAAQGRKENMKAPNMKAPKEKQAAHGGNIQR